ncbi:MAG TPA: FtsW/RodA/SpoVE family cell cycle protein, partial [Pedobacter sp.]|nr:FtsW/RodA/SpoVE family cell cycle protein [Pedobacter sp.]
MINRRPERIFLMVITIILCLFFYRLYSVTQAKFADVNERLQAGTMVNLNAKNPATQLRNLLKKGYYFEDPRDIELIENTVAKAFKTNEALDNVGELNKRSFYVLAEEAKKKGGKSFQARVAASKALLGYTGEDDSLLNQSSAYTATVDLALGNYSMNGTILAQETPQEGVIVRLEMIVPQDSLYAEELAEDRVRVTEKSTTFKKVFIKDTLGRKKLEQLTAYTRTDANGRFNFEQLPAYKAFKVLPLRSGFQFGASKGIQSLTRNESFVFYQNPHTIKLFSTRDFNILKKEKSMIVRTPATFNSWFFIICACFIGSFLFIHLILSWKFKEVDQTILPILMLLTGISFLTLFSLQDPLRDRFLAKDSIVYLLMGLGGMLLILMLKMRRFNADHWVYRLLLFKNLRSAANGWPWIVLAICLLSLTVFFGTGPEGSGVKVNLFGFQPSEVVKYMVIFFLAGFFAVNEKLISEYTSWNKRWSFFYIALIAILLTLMLFLILGDLGPAMVVC